MRCQVLYGPRDLRLENRPEPVLGDRDVLIRVHTVGLCGSDFHRYMGHRQIPGPLVLGHEFSGNVACVGRSVTKFKPGDRATVQPNFGCGECDMCRAGRENLCQERLGLSVNIDGCFADYVAVPEGYAWHIPQGLSYEQAAIAEPLAVAVRAVKRARVAPGDTVAILGAGPVGLLTLQVAKASGAFTVVADVMAWKLELARRLGADAAISGSRQDLLAALEEATRQRGASVVIETAGVPSTVEAALQLVAPGGRVILVGLAQTAAEVVPSRIVSNEVDVLGSYIYTHDEFGTALTLVERKIVDVDAIVSHRLPFDRLTEAFSILERGEGCKVLIEM
ncbi:MAG: alcohol dehydrogenase catalytic domain-containing protein [Firmicutes bacterium]|jgi:L-iditol 2-dehydrogenase|nr:alcohol dehydrogenase catalytic domain-containing protein [Bacillota bacterium]MDH7496793.1 alcohol dehydrogenase catalytic domain-containing protein [Bacillota bacterium]